jgi:hypothetical protein
LAKLRCGTSARTRPALVARDFSNRGMQRPRLDRRPLVQVVLNALTVGHEELCRFPEPSYIANASSGDLLLN